MYKTAAPLLFCIGNMYFLTCCSLAIRSSLLVVVDDMLCLLDELHASRGLCSALIFFLAYAAASRPGVGSVFCIFVRSLSHCYSCLSVACSSRARSLAGHCSFTSHS